MKRNLAFLLCIAMLVLVCLASCESDCEHTFSAEWYNDETHHWHPATCEHAETERGNYEPHADADEDGVCDVCELPVGHIHTFEDVWQSTETHHWKNPTCSHTDEMGEYSTHSDENQDGVCDVCSSHVHKVNGVGYCDHCGEQIKEIDETKLEDLVPAVFYRRYLVNGGYIDYSFTGRSNTSVSFTASKQDLVSYIFGKDNYTNIKVNTHTVNGGNEASGTFESWHELDGADSAFGVYIEDDGELTLDIAEVNKLNGHYIALSTLAGDYGVEATLYALYEAAMSDTTKNLKVEYNTEGNKVTFAYNYDTLIVNSNNIVVGDEAGNTVHNANYFAVEVTFTYTDEFALTSLDITVDVYTTDPGTADGAGFLYDDVDIQYDPDTETYYFVKYDYDKQEFVPADSATPDTYVISVTQTIGERTEENPNHKQKYVPDNFNLYLNIDEDGNLSNKLKGDVSMNVGDVVNFYVGDCTPAGTSLHFAADAVSIKLYKDGALIEDAEDYMNTTAVAMFTFAGSQRSFFVVPKADGAYKFEIYLAGKLLKTINIYAGIVNVEDVVTKDNEFAVVVTEKYEWANKVSFTATETGKYYFNLPAGVGVIDADKYDVALNTPATDDGPEPYFDYNNAKNNDGTYNPGSFSLQLEAGQTVNFYINSVKKGVVIISFFCI